MRALVAKAGNRESQLTLTFTMQSAHSARSCKGTKIEKGQVRFATRYAASSIRLKQR